MRLLQYSTESQKTSKIPWYKPVKPVTVQFLGFFSIIKESLHHTSDRLIAYSVDILSPFHSRLAVDAFSRCKVLLQHTTVGRNRKKWKNRKKKNTAPKHL